TAPATPTAPTTPPAPVTPATPAAPTTPPAPATPVTPDPTDGTTEGSLKPEECAPRCEVRCSKTHHKKPCLFYCKYCCAKCLCVPPGTYGNKEVCPCYNNWKTQEGGPKCP
ncbi:gibberellin induced protein, partial [Trifolium pratense]